VSNKYFSILRQFRVPNVLDEETLAPPADITNLGVAYYQIADIPPGTISPQSKVVVRRVGIFSNFADGLVFKEPFGNFQATIKLYGAKVLAGGRTGTYANPYGSKTVVGLTGSIDGIPSNGIIKLDDGRAGQYGIVEYGGVGNTLLQNYATVNAGAFTEMQGVAGSEKLRIFGIRTLNELQEVNEFLDPGVDILTTATDVLLAATIDNAPDLLTKSIDASFAGEKVTFDLVVELEYTAQVV